MALTTLAGLYVDLGRPADALRVADKCVTVTPSLPDGHFARGCALEALGRPGEARAAFEAAIAAGATGSLVHFVVDDEITAWKAYNEIARSFLAENRFAEAEEWFERGLARSPKARTLLLNRARAREAQGDFAGALSAFRAVYEEFRDEAAAIEYVNYVLRHDSPDEVLVAVEAALPLLGDDYRRAFLASAAAVMLRAQRRGDAFVLVRQALVVGNVPSAGHAVVKALAQHYGSPELADVLNECFLSMVPATAGPSRDAR
jgi:tetratricopeptide (TPR) repeat protein